MEEYLNATGSNAVTSYEGEKVNHAEQRRNEGDQGALNKWTILQ